MAKLIDGLASVCPHCNGETVPNNGGISCPKLRAEQEAAQHRVQRTAGTWCKFLNFVGRVASSLRRR